MLSLFRILGDYFLNKAFQILETLSVMFGVVRLAVMPSTWSKPVRSRFLLQLVFTGYDGIEFILTASILTGIAIISQVQDITLRLGGIGGLGGIMGIIVIREIGPLLVNFIVIGRSGTAISAEIATMKVRGEVDTLVKQGVDPMIYLIVPRVLAMMISVFCLSVIFVISSFLSGYLFSVFIGRINMDARSFLSPILSSVSKMDIISFFLKTLLPGFVSGVIACREGLTIEGKATEIPQAVTKVVMESTVVMIIISTIVTVIGYL